MPAGIQITPLGQGNVIPFGPRTAGATGGLTVMLFNNGNANLVFATPSTKVIIGVGNAGDFSVQNPPDGVTIAPGNAYALILLFRASSPHLTAENATLQFFSNAVAGPTSVMLTGTSALVTDNFVLMGATLPNGQVGPAIVPFGDVTGTSVSASRTLVIINPTSSNQTVTYTPLAANGYSTSNIAGANPIPPGGQMTLNLVITPTANHPNQDDINALAVTVPSGTFTQFFEAQWNTAAFIPAFIVPAATGNTLIGALNENGVSSLLTVAADGSIACEEGVSFSQIFDMKQPDLVKTILRFLLQYEGFPGGADVTVTFVAVDPTINSGQPQIASDTRSQLNGPGPISNALFQLLFDNVSVSGALIQMIVSAAANTGSLSITAMYVYYDTRGEIIEGT